MRRTLLAGAALLLATGAAHAVTPVTSAPFAGTIAAGGTFQQVLPKNTNRAGCLLFNTSSDTFQVYIGPSMVQATMAAQALPVPAGTYIGCDLLGGGVIQSPVWATSTTSGDTYRGSEQQ